MVESFKWKNSNHYILQFKAKSIFYTPFNLTLLCTLVILFPKKVY